MLQNINSRFFRILSPLRVWIICIPVFMKILKKIWHNFDSYGQSQARSQSNCPSWVETIFFPANFMTTGDETVQHSRLRFYFNVISMSYDPTVTSQQYVMTRRPFFPHTCATPTSFHFIGNRLRNKPISRRDQIIFPVRLNPASTGRNGHSDPPPEVSYTCLVQRLHHPPQQMQ